jgi:hypothetical protein
LLEKVLVRCTEKGLKLNPKKCAFFQQEALWCGKIVSADGIRHDPARVSAQQDLPPPVTGGDLLQFVCAVNWMRLSIPAHNRIVEPLREALERVYTAAQGRTKRKAAGVRLSDVGWVRRRRQRWPKSRRRNHQWYPSRTLGMETGNGEVPTENLTAIQHLLLQSIATTPLPVDCTSYVIASADAITRKQVNSFQRDQIALQ